MMPPTDFQLVILRSLIRANEWRFTRGLVADLLSEDNYRASTREAAYQLKLMERGGLVEKARKKLSQYGWGWRITKAGIKAAEAADVTLPG